MLTREQAVMVCRWLLVHSTLGRARAGMLGWLVDAGDRSKQVRVERSCFRLRLGLQASFVGFATGLWRMMWAGRARQAWAWHGGVVRSVHVYVHSSKEVCCLFQRCTLVPAKSPASHRPLRTRPVVSKAHGACVCCGPALYRTLNDHVCRLPASRMALRLRCVPRP